MTRTPLTLRIVTFNVASGYLFTANRRERMAAIGARLRDLDPDLVALQEAFTARDNAVLLEQLQGSRLVHQARFPAGVVGNGMLTLSAWPIAGRLFHRFRHGSPWYKVHQGDWWAGKGIGLTRIALPDGGGIDFYNTHTQPDRGDPANIPARHCQLRELADFVNHTRRAGVPLFVAGDFNTGLECDDLLEAQHEARLTPLMGRPSQLDFIFAGATGGVAFELLETLELGGMVRGRHGALFLDRAPTPREWWRMNFGAAEATAWSDHPGYLSTVRVVPAEEGPA